MYYVMPGWIPSSNDSLFVMVKKYLCFMVNDRFLSVSSKDFNSFVDNIVLDNFRVECDSWIRMTIRWCQAYPDHRASSNHLTTSNKTWYIAWQIVKTCGSNLIMLQPRWDVMQLSFEYGIPMIVSCHILQKWLYATARDHINHLRDEISIISEVKCSLMIIFVGCPISFPNLYPP